MIKVKIHDETGWERPTCSVCDELTSTKYFISTTGPVCDSCEKKTHNKKKNKKKKAASKTEEEYLKIIVRLRSLCYNSVVWFNYDKMTKGEQDVVDGALELLKKKKYGADLPFAK